MINKRNALGMLTVKEQCEGDFAIFSQKRMQLFTKYLFSYKKCSIRVPREKYQVSRRRDNKP